MSVTPQDAVKRAQNSSQEEHVRDYLAEVAHKRPAYDAKGTPSEELEIARLARWMGARYPTIPFRDLERESRDTVLWWRWPLENQVSAWLKGRWPFEKG